MTRKFKNILNLDFMKESLHNRVLALAKRAREEGKKQNIKTVGSSSLHQVIKTREQADKFMKSL